MSRPSLTISPEETTPRWWWYREFLRELAHRLLAEGLIVRSIVREVVVGEHVSHRLGDCPDSRTCVPVLGFLHRSCRLKDAMLQVCSKLVIRPTGLLNQQAHAVDH